MPRLLKECMDEFEQLSNVQDIRKEKCSRKRSRITLCTRYRLYQPSSTHQVPETVYPILPVAVTLFFVIIANNLHILNP